MEEDNLKMCEEMTGIKVIACVKDGDEELEIDIETLERTFS
jgi:dethiobiotin synthetase